MGAVRRRKITVIVPVELLNEATRTTGRGVTATVIEALGELRKREMRSALRGLRGRVTVDLDLRSTRR